MKKFYFAIALIFSFASIFSNPVITSQPSSMTKCLGSSAAISVTATGTAPITYQWKKNGANIIGQTSNTLNFPSLALTDDASYVCVVTDASTISVTSNIALIHVAPAIPSITTQPVGNTICEGVSTSFNVVASGLYMGYQWMHNGVNITNGFGDIYAIGSATSSNSGTYSCLISNACGSVTTNNATLTVNIPPTITVEPTNQTICIGANGTFTVVATGTGLSYLWKKDGNAISGANTSTLTLPNISAADEASYNCTIWNNCDTVISNSVVLTTNIIPSITAQPYSYNECAGENIEFITTAVGTAPIFYQWYHQGNVILDSTNNTLTIPSIAASNSGNYYCGITNVCGTISTNTVTLNVKLAPIIVTQPEGRIRCVGDTVSFAVKVAGEEPFTYQWMWQGTNLSATNNSILSLTNINEGDAGNYSCLITNVCGQILTDTATLVVKTAPSIVLEPVSETVCEATYTVMTVQVIGSELLSYSWEHDGVVIPGSGHEHYTINPVTPASAGTYQCFVNNMCGADSSSVITINVNTLPHVTLQPTDQATCINGDVTFNTTATGTGPLTYHWMKDNVQIGGATSTSYSMTNIQPIDAGNYSCQIFNICGDTITETAVLVVNESPSVQTTLYNRTRCEGDSVSFHVSATGGTLLYQWMHDGIPSVGETSNILLYNDPSVSESGLYYCVVHNNCGIDSTNTITLTVNPAAVVNLGSNVSLCTGESVTLTAGSFMLYHWNESMAYTPSVTVDTAGIFILEAWNQFSCKGSDTVVVSVNPVLHVSLGNDTSSCGNYNLNAGSGAASYSWNNGLGTSQVFTVTTTGTYYVLVTAPGGCQSGDTILVTVNSVPVFNLGNDTSITNRDTIVLNGPSGSYTYYWAGIGSNAQSLMIIGNETSLGLHSYSLQVTNTSGCTASDAINVTILLNEINDLNSDELLNLYPNPTNGNITLQFNNGNYKEYKLEIINILGQTLQTSTIESRVSGMNPRLDLSNFPKGNYFIKLSSSDKTYFKKITLQ